MCAGHELRDRSLNVRSFVRRGVLLTFGYRDQAASNCEEKKGIPRAAAETVIQHRNELSSDTAADATCDGSLEEIIEKPGLDSLRPAICPRGGPRLWHTGRGPCNARPTQA